MCVCVCVCLCVVSDINPLNIKTIAMKIVQEDVGFDQLIVATYIEDNDSLCYLPFPDTILYFFPYIIFKVFLVKVFAFKVNSFIPIWI